VFSGGKIEKGGLWDSGKWEKNNWKGQGSQLPGCGAAHITCREGNRGSQHWIAVIRKWPRSRSKSGGCPLTTKDPGKAGVGVPRNSRYGVTSKETT